MKEAICFPIHQGVQAVIFEEDSIKLLKTFKAMETQLQTGLVGKNLDNIKTNYKD